jgi:hypothetical protein
MYKIEITHTSPEDKKFDHSFYVDSSISAKNYLKNLLIMEKTDFSNSSDKIEDIEKNYCSIYFLNNTSKQYFIITKINIRTIEAI